MKDIKPIVIGIGEILWDMLHGGKVLGGAPANFSYHCSQLGAVSYVISAVGKDIAGSEILEKFEQMNLPTEYLFIEENFPTSKVSVKLDHHGQPEYTIHENVAWDYIPVQKSALNHVSEATAVCFGSLAQRSPLSRKSIQFYLERTKKDCLKVFDVNLRQNYFSRELIEKSLGLTNILKLNIEELEILSQTLLY